MVLAAATVCEEKKGTDIRILELDPVDSGLSDFFLIASGSNTRQTGAIADDIELRMKREFGTYVRSVEGRRKGDWIVLDYTDFVVHIFTPETREFYDIERLRKSARPLDAAELANTLRRKTVAVRERPQAAGNAAGAPAAKKARKAVAKKAAVKTVSKKAPAKKSPAKKTAVKKTTVTQAPARKTTGTKRSAGPRK